MVLDVETEDLQAAGSSKLPLGEQAYDLIKTAIVTCELVPGTEITETEMSQKLGLGKAPVRAGLSRLFQDGLVQPLPRRGYQITPITLKDIHESIEVRGILEPQAARNAATRMSEEMISELRREAETQSKTRTNATFERNRHFHLAIARASNNQRLLRMITELIDQMERVSRLLMKTRTLRSMKHEYEVGKADHMAILDAIEAQDADRAEAAARQHIETTRKMTMDALIETNAVELRIGIG